MKAIVQHQYGTSDVLTLEEVEKPTPKDGEVLVRVHAVSLNGSDWEGLRGKPFYARLGGLRTPSNPILGSDIAGRVEAVGENAKQFQPGDEVFGEMERYRGGMEIKGKMTNAGMPQSSGLRVAVLSDIHGNLRALNAVLEEVEREQTDAIVIGGDVASGPFPGDTLERLMGLGERAYFVRGNADRELISAYDRQLPFNPKEEDPALLLPSWDAQQLNQKQRDFLAGFQERVVLDILGLGRVLFCHGSPRSDEEIITRLTSEEILAKFFLGLEEKTVVCGHTHHQFDRKTNGYRVINAGSIGMPYEGQPGAYWARLGPIIQLRRTEYDVDQAVTEAIAAGYPDAEYRETLLTPPTSLEVATYFEQVAAERGERNQ